MAFPLLVRLWTCVVGRRTYLQAILQPARKDPLRNGTDHGAMRPGWFLTSGACSSPKHDGPPPSREAARCWTHVLSSPASPSRTFRPVKQAIQAQARWQPQVPEREGWGHNGFQTLDAEAIYDFEEGASRRSFSLSGV